MKILITGAGGLVGSAVTQKLMQKHDVYTTEINAVINNSKHIVCDLSKAELVDVFEKYSFDSIIHCAAVFPKSFLNDESNTGNINRKIDDNIINLACKKNSKIIFISSINVYGETDGMIISENTPLNYNNDYAKNKVITEKILEQKLVGNSCSLRLSSPYGPGQKNRNVLKAFIDKAKEGLPLQYYGNGSRTQNFIDVRDIANAIEVIIDNNSTGIFNIAGSEEISMKSLANAVAKSSDKVFNKLVTVEAAGFADPQENIRTKVSIKKAERDLGWKPMYSIMEGIENWMKVEKVT